jgi:phosphatidate cytidylyltransferase
MLLEILGLLMSKELIKRLITSIFILTVTVYSIYLGALIFNLFLLLIFIIALIEWKNLTNNRIIFSLGLLFLFLSLISVYVLRYENFHFFIFILIISVSSDVGGYVFGKLLGGPKLTKISPNKTYAGMCGSYLFSFILGISYLYFFNKLLLSEKLSFSFFIILLISTVNQIGDLIISFFKRKQKIKDTGKLLPGHGGLLDRIDGIIFSYLIGYLINQLFV